MPYIVKTFALQLQHPAPYLLNRVPEFFGLSTRDFEPAMIGRRELHSFDPTYGNYVMSVESYSKEGILTIQFQTPRILDENLLEQVAKDVLALIDKTNEEKVILDFKPVQFMSSSMLGKLVMIQKKCKEYKVKLKLSGVSAEILEVFRVTKLHKFFDMEKDEPAARKAFLRRGLFG